MPSSGMLRHVAPVITEVSEELSTSIIRVTRIGELGTTLAITSNRRTHARSYLHLVPRLYHFRVMKVGLCDLHAVCRRIPSYLRWNESSRCFCMCGCLAASCVHFGSGNVRPLHSVVPVVIFRIPTEAPTVCVTPSSPVACLRTSLTVALASPFHPSVSCAVITLQLSPASRVQLLSFRGSSYKMFLVHPLRGFRSVYLGRSPPPIGSLVLP
jgi:hypothetical protein